MKTAQSKKNFMRHLSEMDHDTFMELMESLDPSSEEYRIAKELCDENNQQDPISIEEEYNS